MYSITYLLSDLSRRLGPFVQEYLGQICKNLTEFSFLSSGINFILKTCWNKMYVSVKKNCYTKLKKNKNDKNII